MNVQLTGSRFNVTTPTGDGGLLLYNTLRGSLTRIDADEAAEVLAALSEPRGAAAPIVQSLQDQGHLVSVSTDELAILHNRRHLGIVDSGRLDVVVMPTMDCNFDCIYCYEEHGHDTHMSSEVEGALIAWLTAQVPSHRLVMLHFFGGEPLYDVPLISRVTTAARDIADASGARVAAHVTTNGYLLSGWRREALLAAGVHDYQITIDGPARTHDRLRPLFGGRPSYSRVFSNVVGTLRSTTEVVISLRVNLNHTNLDAVEELLDAFPEEIRPRLRLALEPIFGDQTVSATANVDADVLSSRLGELYTTASTMGFDIAASSAGLLTGRLTYCYAERVNQVVVAPDGSIFKCAAGSFDRGDRVGWLTADGHLNYDGAWDDWMRHGDTFPTRCESCVYLPLCMGGCRKAQRDEPGSVCTLVPSNAAYVLKQIGLTGTPHALLERACSNPDERR